LPLSIYKRIKTRQSLKRAKRQFNKAYGTHKTHFRVGDYVQVISGRDAKENKQGKILQMFKTQGFVVVEDVSMRKRLLKRPGKKPEAIERPGKIHVSNVMLVDPSDGKPTHFSMKYSEDGDKLRVSKRTGEIIAWPEKEKDEIRETNDRTDTQADVVEAKTFREEELIALKNKYLRAFELHHYKQLQEDYEAQQKQQKKQELEDQIFSYDVITKAKELLRKRHQIYLRNGGIPQGANEKKRDLM